MRREPLERAFLEDRVFGPGRGEQRFDRGRLAAKVL